MILIKPLFLWANGEHVLAGTPAGFLSEGTQRISTAPDLHNHWLITAAHAIKQNNV